MSVQVRRRGDLPNPQTYDCWVEVGREGLAPEVEKPKLAGAGRRLEAAFEDIREDWYQIGRRLQGEPSGHLSHAASVAPSPSDFGIMLAWRRFVETLARDGVRALVVCDDPWLYRELAAIDGVAHGRPPPLLPMQVRLWLRGCLARTLVAIRNVRALTALRRFRLRPRADSYVLVYGHPASDDKGGDAYFGNLLEELPALHRAIHTDCPLPLARQLCRHDSTEPLDAWGDPLHAFKLLFAKWRASAAARTGEYGWLIRRAVAIEGGGGAGAMTSWQVHCQRNWLRDRRPKALTWPWENHPWERALVRAARGIGSHTYGYLHTVVGAHMINQSPRANADGLDSIPDLVLCNGPAYGEDLAALGMPGARLVAAGAYRFQARRPVHYDAGGPIFVALSGNRTASRHLLDAIGRLSRDGLTFAVKDHPMYPMQFEESENLKRTERSLHDQPGVSAVVFCATVVGLEAYLAGIPAVRFIPDGTVALNVLPTMVEMPAADAGELGDAIRNATLPDPIDWGSVFAPVDIAVWRRLLEEV